MKNIYYFIILSLLFVACAGGEKKPQFQPKVRTSSLSNADREFALEQKRAELAEVNVDTLLSSHSLRMTIAPPQVTQEFSENLCKKAIVKLVTIGSQNGICGVNGSSPIALALSLDAKERSMTGTAPQKALVKYDALYSVANLQTGDVYASCLEEITGVGETFEDAANHALNELKNTPAIQQMIQSADGRIISWFNQNASVIQNKVNAAVGAEDFALALALVNSVPEEAKVCYAKVGGMQQMVLLKLKQKVAAVELGALKDAIAQAGGDFSPEPGGHLAMLPPGTPEYKEGHAAYDRYIKQIDATRMARIKAEERIRLEEIEMQKLEMKYEMEAASKASSGSGGSSSSSSNSSGGGLWGGVKKFFTNVGVYSAIQSVLSSCLFIF